MQTEIIKVHTDSAGKSVIEQDAIERAGQIIKNGGLVAFPTETVYGLGGDAFLRDAAKRIYAAKGRPSDNPLIIHIAEIAALERVAEEIPDSAFRLAERFWSGPLTMILKKKDEVPLETTGALSTVAVRMPDHPVALALIRAGGGFVAAPSANTSGRPSPTRASHVEEDLSGRIEMILDGGTVGIGIESTIVDLTDEVPTILRPGYITAEMLGEVLGEVRMDPGIIDADSGIAPKAPGMKYRHYAPNAELVVVEGPAKQVTEEIKRLAGEGLSSGKRVGIIATEETEQQYPEGTVLCIGRRSEEETVARHLYEVLRRFDELGMDIIYSESFSDSGIGQAIMNRLLKAAGHQVIGVL